MSVNTMGIEQAYTLINAIHAQATGKNSLNATDLSSFISVAQETLQTGYEPTLNAITQVIGRTIVSVRPYNEKFKGLEMSSDRWGGITRKINFADTQSYADETWALVDGQAIDPFIVRKPNILETRYVGSDVYCGELSVTREQLTVAFSNPTEFAAFMSGLMTWFVNQRTQWLENLKRMILCNAIAGIADENLTGRRIKLLTEYNNASGLSLTSTTVMQPANFPGFMKWAYTRISNISHLMTERSGLYQTPITGKDLNRHTPVEDQRIYMTSKYLDAMTDMVLADVYHDNFLRYADVEPVNFWQAIGSPDSVSVKPVYIDGSGTVKVASGNVSVSPVVGIMFDRDALGYNIYQDELETSPYNQRGQYYNLAHHVRVQLQNDFTEKMVLLTLD